MQPPSGVEAIREGHEISGAETSRLGTQYQYEPLIAEDAVRMLVLEPADDFESPLRCSVIQSRRDSQSLSASGCEYSAVSYTWGNNTFSHQLFVRHDAQSWHCLHITASVDSLLRHLRVPYKPRTFWIDAICLNQKDEAEKTQQIPLMGRIYSDAKRVDIWLGDDEAEKAARAFTIIRRIEYEEERMLDEEEEACLADFFNRPWFSRRWIIQEAVFSHDAVFHCGFHKLGLSRVMAALRKTEGWGSHALVARGSRMLLSSDGLGQGSEKGILSLLWDFHDSDCSDPRDRIGAVYALVSGPKWPLRQYDPREWKQMYVDVASYYINSDWGQNAHDILCHLCLFGPFKSETGKIPGWVPDWSAHRQNLLPDVDISKFLCGGNGYSDLEYKASRLPLLGTAPFPIPPRVEEAFDWLLQRRLFSTEIDASAQRLRLDYHPLAFIFHGGIVDRVICPSTASDFWQEVMAACEPPDSARYKPVGSRTELDLLLELVGDMLCKGDDATNKHGRDGYSYRNEMRGAVEAYQNDPDTLSAAHNMILQDVSSSLGHSTIMKFRGLESTRWAIGPPDSQVGDWVMPFLVLSQLEADFIPMMCLRPIDLPGAEELRQISLASSIRRRCLRFFSGVNDTEVICRHVIARFVGHAIRDSWSTPDINSLLGDDWDGDCDEEREQTLEIILQAIEAARGRGLPGALVFDVV